MSRKITPYHVWSFPSVRFPFSFFEDEGEGLLQHFEESSGLSVSEDEKNVYIEASVPGIRPEEIEISYEKGILWIKAMKKEETEDKKRKFYRKATSSFSYRVALPSNVEEGKQPEANCKNGILKVTFSKKKKSEAKKIPVKGA